MEGRLVLLRERRARRRGMGRGPGPQDPARQLAAGIRRRATAYGYSPAERAGAGEAARYLENKQQYLDYATALSKGWPIATGIIEGACRHIVKDRMDITGARWGLEGAEAISCWACSAASIISVSRRMSRCIDRPGLGQD